MRKNENKWKWKTRRNPFLKRGKLQVHNQWFWGSVPPLPWWFLHVCAFETLEIQVDPFAAWRIRRISGILWKGSGERGFVRDGCLLFWRLLWLVCTPTCSCNYNENINRFLFNHWKKILSGPNPGSKMAFQGFWDFNYSPRPGIPESRIMAGTILITEKLIKSSHLCIRFSNP